MRVDKLSKLDPTPMMGFLEKDLGMQRMVSCFDWGGGDIPEALTSSKIEIVQIPTLICQHGALDRLGLDREQT